jgi:hypothetical protein
MYSKEKYFEVNEENNLYIATTLPIKVIYQKGVEICKNSPCLEC